MSVKPTCSICLEDANARGGEPLTAPGCCGKWFHKRCIDAAVAAGNVNCPECRAPLPIAAPVSVPVPAHVVSALAPAVGFPRRQGFSFGCGATSSVSSAPATGIASPNFEDALLPVPPEATADSASAAFSVSNVTVSLTAKPEKPHTHTKSHPQFYASLEIKYDNPEISAAKTSVDIVCVLDVSGSMGGEKIENLKKAMEFVISTMGPTDRLSVVSFNDRSYRIHGLARMTEENKGTSKRLVNNLHAGGGTSIYDGMHAGWEVLSSRAYRNSSSCMFLLTDGQDHSNRDRQLAIARDMKAAGTSLFAFGFGDDHDSELMSSISEAAESVFTYVDTPDSVIDAFGGALGSQQGMALRNIVVNAAASVPGVKFKSAKSGIYQTIMTSGGAQFSTRFSNMYPGERRSILVEMALTDTTGGQLFSFLSGFPEIIGQPLFTANASYDIGTEVIGMKTDDEVCLVDRLSDGKLDTTAVRDRDVDAEINRSEVSAILQTALRLADHDKISEARTLITNAIAKLRSSVSFQTQHPAVSNLEVDLEDAQRSLSSRAEYMCGGRALMSEGYSDMSRQRCTYTKSSKNAMYQSPSSAQVQSSARASKTPHAY